MKPTVTIIIVNWNGRHHLEACFSALAEQTQKGFETIMVDNASRDGSVAYVRQTFPWVRLILLPENRGFSGGNIAGLQAITVDKEMVVLLNNDTAPELTWLERLVAAADAHPECGIVAAHLTDWEGIFTDSAGDGCRVTGRGYARHRGLPSEGAPASGPCFGACAGAALYRREMIADVGFLDDEFFLNFEDTDLSVRARLLGWKAWFCREAVVRHRVSASQRAWSPWNSYYGARNHVWVCAKNLPTWLLVKYAPLTCAEMIALAWRAARHGRLSDYLAGVFAGIRGFDRQRAKWRELNLRRRLTTRELEDELTLPSLRWASRGRRTEEVRA